MPEKPKRKTAMISSTSLDLPEHRQHVMDACQRMGVTPIMMEHLPASDDPELQAAVNKSLGMVNEADIYIGIFAHRYGWVPDGQDISITEMEFNRAVERKIPILVFLMHREHPITIDQVEASDAAREKLESLKARASKGRIRAEFKSPEDLRGLVIHALAELEKQQEESTVEKKPLSLHPPNLIPTAPAPYIAHPYSLLQTREVIGRRAELHQLTDWVTANQIVPRDVRLFNVVAIGGMGKSTLTWKWFNDIAPNELPHLAGRMWWSFYESDAYFENFVIRALAYTTGLPEGEVRQMSAQEREDQLWHVLDQRPFLLVLDGLERILLAYARMDAEHLSDDGLDEQTANDISQFYGLPDNVKETYLEKHRLRQCTDPRAGYFLRRLAQVHASRVLISTRLYPAELQTNTAQPRPGCYPFFLTGLSDDDALALWRAFIGGERSGTRGQLLPLFRAFGNYPLLLRALAGEVAEYRPALGDLDCWRQAHADFNPAALPLQNARTHVLAFALRGLSAVQRHVLHTIAAFRMPATWETLCAVLVGTEKQKPCQGDGVLDATLTELEDRGLVGWNKSANRYDLHPIVRGVVWQALDACARRDIYGALYSYFDAAPRPPEWENVESLEDLTPGIELFHTLIGLERYEDAYMVFRDHLNAAMLYRLSASRQRGALLERLFPDGMGTLPRLVRARHQSDTLDALAGAYLFSGELGRAVSLFRRAVETDEYEKDGESAAIALCNLSHTLQLSGHLRETETAACRALGMCREQGNRFQEGVSLLMDSVTLAACGAASPSAITLCRALNIWVAQKDKQGEGVVNAYLAQRCLWRSQPGEALPLAQRAWKLAHVHRHEHDFIRAARLHGEAALGVGDLITATERLHHALTSARAINLFEEELPALTSLAELHRRQQHYDAAREFLDQVWIPAERGPYPLFHADALNVLAQLERDQGHREAAVTAATEAYRQAWCDGPPYAYYFGLTNARRHLRELDVLEPQMPPFDASKYAPMPEVELDPEDEFHVGKTAEA
jgi:tetratricopeptide (TPR) repeat protein